MTREEEIKQAAEQFADREHGAMRDVSVFNLLQYAFKCGAEWADEHPNLSSLWHDASEEPKGDEWHIAYIDVFGSMQSLKCPSVTFDTFPSLAEFAVGVGMQCWAYISDLLPKQFGISDHLKKDKEKKN